MRRNRRERDRNQWLAMAATETAPFLTKPSRNATPNLENPQVTAIAR